MNTQTSNTRTKQVFPGREVPHIWANQSQNSARNSQGNVFFEGKTIFSYGKHFPIATIEGNDVLFTLRSYSNTTAKHISHVRGAISHKNIIYCHEVPVPYYGDKNPVNKQSFTLEHSKNLNYWKGSLNNLFTEIGNKRNRDITGRINLVTHTIGQLNRYCEFFNLQIKDKELKSLLSLAASPDFIEKARVAAEKEEIARERKLDIEEKKIQKGAKLYNVYVEYWRNFNTEAIADIPQSDKVLISLYQQKRDAYTRLRFNTETQRIETSKGVHVPVEIAHRAWKAIKDCTDCKDIAVPVMEYTITQANANHITAGCHTIPQSDVKYIAQLLNW